MTNQFDGIARVTKSIATSTAVNPAPIVCTVLALPCFVMSYLSEPPMSYFFGLSAVAILITVLWQIVRFTIYDPDRLQNDKHVENKMMISTLGGKFGDKNLEITIPANATASSNPQITGGRDD